MRFLRFAVLALLALLPPMGEAQTTQIIATSVNVGNVALNNGQLCLIPVTPTGQPQTFSANGSLYLAGDLAHVQGGFCAPVYNGAITKLLSVPDRAAASASYPLCYEVIAVNQQQRPFDLGTRCDITGASVSLNHYVPPVAPPVYASGYSHGPAASLPAHCSLGALYATDDTHALYLCGLDGVFHLLGTASGGTTPPPSGAMLLADTSGSGSWNVTASNGRVLVASGSGSGAVAGTLFADTATSGSYWRLTSTAGRLSLASASSDGTAVSTFSLTDAGTGASRTLSVANGRLNLN